MGDSGGNPFLHLVEELTTKTPLPLPPLKRSFDGSNMPLAESMIQLFAELALSLRRIGLFMIENPTGVHLQNTYLSRRVPSQCQGGLLTTSWCRCRI